MVIGSAGRAGAAGSGSMPAGSDEASSPARNPASHARCTALAGPTTRLRRLISSSAKGAVFGIGDMLTNDLQRRREQVVDDGEDDEQRDTGAEAPADQLLLDRQQRLERGPAKFFPHIGLRHDALL